MVWHRGWVHAIFLILHSLIMDSLKQNIIRHKECKIKDIALKYKEYAVELHFLEVSTTVVWVITFVIYNTFLWSEELLIN